MKENLSMSDQNLLLSKKDKIKILKNRDGIACAICSKNINKNQEITIDHWIPRSAGGSDDIDNLKLAHKKCNSWKGDRLPNDDGTIPPRPTKVKVADDRKKKKSLVESICPDCLDGRLLLEGENCLYCGVPAGPEDWPHWAKRPANKCKHTAPQWCWACSIGIVDRKPVYLILLEGE